MKEIFFVTGIDGKYVKTVHSIDEAIKIADEENKSVFVWNKTMTGVELVYSAGESKLKIA